MTFIYNLVGTLSNPLHRAHLLGARMYEEYNEEFYRDTVNEDVLNHFAHVSEDDITVVISSMREIHRNRIEEWLRYNGIYPDELLLCPNRSYQKEPEAKFDLLINYFGSKEQMILHTEVVLETDDKVVEKLRNEGLRVWQVR